MCRLRFSRRNRAQHHSQRHHQRRRTGVLRLRQGILDRPSLHVGQSPLPLRLGLRRRLLRHRGGLSGGRGQDPLHELSPGQLPRSGRLRRPHVGGRRTHGFLQRVRAILCAAGLLERLHVRHLRTVKTPVLRLPTKERLGVGHLLIDRRLSLRQRQFWPPLSIGCISVDVYTRFGG